MWTPDHSYWPQKKNSSYYPALFEIPFPSWKITEKIQFFPKKQPFSIKEKEAQNGLDSMRSFFFGVTPSSHEKWSNPYRKWRLSGRSIFNFLVQKQLFFIDFHSNSFKWENIKRGGVCLDGFFWPEFAKEYLKNQHNMTMHQFISWQYSVFI